MHQAEVFLTGVIRLWSEERAVIRVSLHYSAFCFPFRHHGGISKKLCIQWFGHSGNGARRNFLWVNTEEKGKATFTWIIKFSVLQTEYKLAPPIVTNEGCLSENRRADSQRGLVGRPQPRPSCIHHPLNQSTNSTPPFVINYANQPTITLRWHCSCY